MTQPDKPLNVLMLTIDALRADRTNLHGYDRPTTPTLERLAKNAIVCDRTISLAPFTQPASVQLFTSSKPLSFGGYDLGAIGRPKTVFQLFHDAGYKTSMLSTLHWVNRFFGYGDGVDEEFQLFSLITLPGAVLAIIRNSLSGYDAGTLSEDDMLSFVEPLLLKFFDDVLSFSANYQANESRFKVEFPDAPFVNAQYDYRKIETSIARHRGAFLDDKTGYIRRHLLPAPSSADWMTRWLPREWYYARKPTKLASEMLFRAASRVIGLIDPSLARARNSRFKNYTDARALGDKVIKLLEGQDGEKPFFIWTHYMETHAPYLSGPGRKWWRHTPRYLKELGYPDGLDPSLSLLVKPRGPEDEPVFSALYDGAIRYIDEEIGRIVDALDRLGLRENTLIAISGDHGEELGEHGEFGHFFKLHNHCTHVPMFFHNPNFAPQRIDGLTTIMDFAPTVAALVNIDRPESWEGDAVTDPSIAKRPYVIPETFYGGNCLFKHRPLYMAVRTHQWNYIWKEYRDPSDPFGPDEPELYDLLADPAETNNLYRPDHPQLPEFNTAIAERMAEIPEITDQRIVDCFGAIGSEAIKRLRNMPKAVKS